MIVLAALVLGCSRSAPPPAAPAPPKLPEVGSNRAIDAARLKGARLRSIRDNPPVEWVFNETDFSVSMSGLALPVDVTEPLLGAGTEGTRVEGKWRLDEARSELVLTELRGGDVEGRKEAALPLQPAGPVRANLGTRQYNIVRQAGQP